MKALRAIFFSWLPLAIAITGACLLVSLAVQQNYRQGLNDPQIQMAEDAAAALASGKQPDNVVPTAAVDIGASLSPWLEVYSAAGVPLLSSGKLNGEVPQIPEGVLTAAKNNAGKYADQPNEDRVTWQPEPDVRQAIVVVSYNSQNGTGYVVAGRSMREVENREGQLSAIIFSAWFCIMGASLIAQVLAYYLA